MGTTANKRRGCPRTLFFFVFSSPSPTNGQCAVLVSSNLQPDPIQPPIQLPIQASPCQQHYLSFLALVLTFFLFSLAVCRELWGHQPWVGEGKATGGALPTRHLPPPSPPSSHWDRRLVERCKRLRCKLNLCC